MLLILSDPYVWKRSLFRQQRSGEWGGHLITAARQHGRSPSPLNHDHDDPHEQCVFVWISGGNEYNAGTLNGGPAPPSPLREYLDGDKRVCGAIVAMH
jgi:hypothetical protein